jgi:integrase/recombinase XerD
MLAIYRRHTKNCRYTARDERNCRCPIWYDWHVDGRRIRKPIGLADWQRALLRARDIESAEPGTEVAPTVATACETFLRDLEARHLQPASLKKYNRLSAQLNQFAEAKGLVFISDLNLSRVREFRDSWTNVGYAAARKLGYLREFLKFCQESKWIPENYAVKLRAPRIAKTQVQPFTTEQQVAILAAIPAYPDPKNRNRLRAFVLLLRYSGLRIADAATLRKSDIQDGRLMLRTAKTGATVYVPLPPVVMSALADLPELPFWTGKSKPHTVASVWSESLKNLFRLAGVPDGHAHRYRHTFAIELLLAGVPIERVSILLGHSSVRTTEKHYSAWNQPRQQQAEQDVMRTWSVEARKAIKTVTYTAHGSKAVKNRRKSQ